jgi:hypothetical protein
MKLMAATLIAGLAGGLCTGLGREADTAEVKSAQAFKEWGDYFVSGVWTTTKSP